VYRDTIAVYKKERRIMTTEYVETKTAYGFGTHLDLPFDEAMRRTRDALKEQGFGVLTEIDVQATLKQKINADFRRYVILGACNPTMAHRALQAELDLGLLLPCNVVLYEEDGGTTVRVMDPVAALSLATNPAIAPVAAEVRVLLEQALHTLRHAEN
jgi:uncharacterized protein (DUF302 family)